MTLWEREIDPLKGGLGWLDPSERLALAVAAIDHVYQTEPTSVMDAETIHCIERGIQEGRAAVASGVERIALPSDIISEFEEVADDAPGHGVIHLLTAIMMCVESDPLDADGLYEILYSCYEFAAQRQGLGSRTISIEEANERCREVIAYHKELIAQATS